MSETLSEKEPIIRLCLSELGYPSTQDKEFLDKFTEKLKEAEFDTEELVFSGFDGTVLQYGEEYPELEYVFAVDVRSWRDALGTPDPHAIPAYYANDWKTPYIGLYDKKLLREVYSCDIVETHNPLNDRVELINIQPGELLSDIQYCTEAVVYKDYPEGSIADALVGLVKIED